MQIACENIDLVMNVEMRRRGLPRGNKWRMFQMARALEGEPLSLAAARIFDRPPAHVLIATGAAVPEFMPVGENDGPIGTAVLARALDRMGHTIGVVTDPVAAPPVAALLEHLEVEATVTPIEVGDTALPESLLDAYDVIAAIERLGGNRNGNLHGINGVSRTHHRANLDRLFFGAQERGKPTVAIGDGGNEIGFGRIIDRLEAEMPEFVFKDKTPCGGGVFSVVPADVLVVANSSNIGAYGIAAALALLREDPSLAHDSETDIGLHHFGAGLGLVDGANGQRHAWCDGIPPQATAAVVTIMQALVTQTLAPEHVRQF